MFTEADAMFYKNFVHKFNRKLFGLVLCPLKTCSIFAVVVLKFYLEEVLEVLDILS